MILVVDGRQRETDIDHIETMPVNGTYTEEHGRASLIYQIVTKRGNANELKTRALYAVHGQFLSNAIVVAAAAFIHVRAILSSNCRSTHSTCKAIRRLARRKELNS